MAQLLGSGMDLASVAQDFKMNFYLAVKGLLADDPLEPFVSFGHPGTFEPDDLIGFGRVESVYEFAAFGPKRPQWEDLTLTVTISCYRGGVGEEVEVEASARAYSLLRAIHYYARITDTTMGGVVLWTTLTGHTSDGETDPDSLAEGRTIEVEATFTARARVTN